MRPSSITVSPNPITASLALLLFALACGTESGDGPMQPGNRAGMANIGDMSTSGGQSGSTTGVGAQAGTAATGQGGSGISGGGATSQAGIAGAAAQSGSSQAGASASAGQAGTSGGNAGTDTTGQAGMDGGADALQALREYLAMARDTRPSLADQAFAQEALSAEHAEEAKTLLWDDYAEHIRTSREAETDAKSISLDEFTLRYDYTVFGEAPSGGRSLYLSLHGGGEAASSVNDQQWENQKGLYEPAEGIYLAPRAPTDTWNLWHQPHIDPLFDRLITNFIVLENVDPNRVYVMGYSAGGDGVYQLGPRMADYWAAAAMMAGHPNEAKPDSLRNIGFTIHVGGQDTAFDRNLVAEEWGELLAALQAQDPEGYAHHVEIHPDKPHWMDLEDAVAVPWMAEFTRNPVPDRVVWLQDDVTHDRFYWLSVDEAETGDRVVASYSGQTLSVEAEGVERVTLRLSDEMLDLDQAISVTSGNAELFSGSVSRTIATLAQTLEERGDPELVFSAEVTVEL